MGFRFFPFFFGKEDFFFVLVYNYLAHLKLQTFNKLFVEEQHVNNSCIKVARAQKNPNFYSIVLDSSLGNDLHFLWISNTKKDILKMLYSLSPQQMLPKNGGNTSIHNLLVMHHLHRV